MALDSSIKSSLSLPFVPENLLELEEQIIKREQSIPEIKDNNQARIIWADKNKKARTPLSVVYIHGFTASQGEGDPVHKEFARRYGANLYLSRLAGHGIEHPNAFKEFTPARLIQSAAYALAVGKRLGDKVILMATSTGASLALLIASFYPDIKGLILYSPLIDFYDNRSWILKHSLARTFARFIPGKGYMIDSINENEAIKKVWYSEYRLEGLLALGEYVHRTMKPSVFKKIKQPVFMGYFYKNKQVQDTTVSVPAMLKMFKLLGTPSDKKRKVDFPNAGHHVICSQYTSKAVPRVKEETFKFAEEILQLAPIKVDVAR